MEYVDWEARKIRVELYMLRIENPAEWEETMFTLKVSSRLSSAESHFKISVLGVGWSIMENHLEN